MNASLGIQTFSYLSSMKTKLFFFSLIFCVAVHAQVLTKLDTLKLKLRTQLPDTTRVKTLNSIGWMLALKGKFEESKKYCDSALKLSQKISFKKGEAKALGTLGVIFYDQGIYTEALRYQLGSLKIKEFLNDSEGIAYSYGNIGNLLFSQKKYEEALGYFIKARDILERKKMRQTIPTAYRWIGIVYNKLGRIDEAMDFHLRALALAQENKDLYGIAFSYGNIANIHASKKNFEEALNYFKKNLEAMEEMKNDQGIAAALNNVGFMYFQLHKFSESRIYVLKSLALAEKIHSLNDITEANKSLYKIEEATGNYQKAFTYYRNYDLYSDSITNEETTKKQTQLEMQYGFDKKTAADSIRNTERQKLETLKHESEIRDQKRLTYTGIGGFLVMIVVAGISYNAFRNKKKANIEIARQKTMVEEKQKEILDSIHYARRIQRALIPSEKFVEKQLRRWK